MNNKPSPLIHPGEVRELVNKEKVVIIDARSGPDARDRYRAGHVAGALHVDLDQDLSAKPADAAFGGRHPLPEAKVFASLLGKWGIDPAVKVIVYDDKGGANAAARFWWMLRSVGHEQVYVVNGGLPAIVKEGITLSTSEVMPLAAPAYPVDQWKLPVAGIEKVASAANDPDYIVVDVREGYRYRGESEPIDLVAGHIPGAVNIPYTSNLQPDGLFKSPEELAAFYHRELGERHHSNVIVHCGSGVTACHTLLALEHAGWYGAQLYVGSWSEWSRRNRPIATGD